MRVVIASFENDGTRQSHLFREFFLSLKNILFLSKVDKISYNHKDCYASLSLLLKESHALF